MDMVGILRKISAEVMKIKPPQPEPEPAPAPQAAPPQNARPTRFDMECWLHQHRPDLLAAIRRAEAEAEIAWWMAQGGDAEALRAADAALEAALEAGRRAMVGEPGHAHDREQAQDQEPEPNPDDPVERAAKMFHAERVWDLTDAQAAKIKKVF